MSVIQRMFRYWLTSFGTFLLDLAIVYALTEGLKVYYIASVVIGFTTTTAALFFVNRFWTFKKNVSHWRGLNAAVVALTTLAVVSGVTYAATEYAKLYYMVARLIAAVAGFSWSYVLDSLLTFDIPPFG